MQEYRNSSQVELETEDRRKKRILPGTERRKTEVELLLKRKPNKSFFWGVKGGEKDKLSSGE